MPHCFTSLQTVYMCCWLFVDDTPFWEKRELRFVYSSALSTLASLYSCYITLPKLTALYIGASNSISIVCSCDARKCLVDDDDSQTDRPACRVATCVLRNVPQCLSVVPANSDSNVELHVRGVLKCLCFTACHADVEPLLPLVAAADPCWITCGTSFSTLRLFRWRIAPRPSMRKF